MTVSKWAVIGAGGALLFGIPALIRAAVQPVMPYEFPQDSEPDTQKLQTPVQISGSLPAENPPDLPEQSYTIKLQEDTLYVYENGSRDPLSSYALPADWLPDYDRVILEYGIQVTGQDALRAVLEDYVS